MAGVNSVLVIGNLGKDPEMKFTNEQKAIANFSVATSESWTDEGSGQKKEKVEWHRIVAFGKTAELCGEYLKKGRQVCIQGKLQTREWTDKQGAKRYTTEIVADRVTFLGGGKGEGEERKSSKPAA